MKEKGEVSLKKNPNVWFLFFFLSPTQDSHAVLACALSLHLSNCVTEMLLSHSLKTSGEALAAGRVYSWEGSHKSNSIKSFILAANITMQRDSPAPFFSSAPRCVSSRFGLFGVETSAHFSSQCSSCCVGFFFLLPLIFRSFDQNCPAAFPHS